MKVTSTSFADGARIPGEHAAGVPGAQGPVPGPNRSPHLAWSDPPKGTRSFAVLCRDRDVPSKPDDVNKPDRAVAYDLPRVDFYHWVLVDVPATTTALPAGADSDGFRPRGKPPGPTAHGVRGLNDYTGWFAGDEAMRGDYGGYDGPWPPFNDERLHHYVFTVHALDVPSLRLPARFTAAQALAAMRGHVLAEAAVTGTYALNPRARP
jgi:hypothetical protein